jgi:hypothetical protein
MASLAQAAPAERTALVSRLVPALEAEITRGACSLPIPQLSGRTDLVLPEGHPLFSVNYRYLVNLVIAPSGEVARFRVLKGGSEPVTIAAIRENLKAWRYGSCIVKGEQRSFYASGVLTHYAR